MAIMKKNLRLQLLSLAAFSIFLFTAPLGAAPRQPQWLHSHLNGTLKLTGVYHGISFADYRGKKPDYDAMRLARDRALDDLCYQLSVSVKSDFKNHILKKSGYEEEKIASSLFVSSRKVLSGVREKDRWTNARGRRHWVLLTIDRRNADEQLQQQKFINEVVDRLDRKQDEILEGTKKIAGLLDRHMSVYSEQMKHYEKLLQTIDQKVTSASDQTKMEYDQIRQTLTNLEKRQQLHDQKMAGYSQQQSEQIAELVRQNRVLQNYLFQLSEKVQKDYFLALTNDDLENKSLNPDFRVKIQPEKGQGASYYSKEKIRFQVKASRGCYIKVIYLSSAAEGSSSQKKMNTLLFPNVHDKDNWIRAGETKIIGRYGELEVQPPFGKDVITVVASENQFTDLDDTLRQAAGGYYSEVTVNTRGAIRMRTRGIGVVKAAADSTTAGNLQLSPQDGIASDTCFIVSYPR